MSKKNDRIYQNRQNKYDKGQRGTYSISRYKINKKHIDHVAGKHKKELEKLGFTALDFIRVVINGYNEIREAKDGTYFLANVIDESSTYTAIIGLNYIESKKFWEIKTAIPIRTAVINKKKLIWKRERTPLKI